MDRKNVYDASRRSLLAAGSSVRRTTFLYSLCINLLLFLFYLLSESVDRIGGSGLSAVVQKNQAVSLISAFTVLLSALSVIWDANYYPYALHLCRGEEASFRDFLSAFRRTLTTVFTRLIISVYTYCWTLLFCLPGILLLSFIRIDPLPEVLTEEALLEAVMNSILNSPVAHAALVLCALAAIPGIIMSYRYSLAPILVFDRRIGALQAVQESKLLTAGRKKDLILIDLHFWYFFLLQYLPTAVLLLADYGLLPLSAQVYSVIVYAQYPWFLLLTVWKLPEVAAARVCALDAILKQQEPPAEEAPLRLEEPES